MRRRPCLLSMLMVTWGLALSQCHKISIPISFNLSFSLFLLWAFLFSSAKKKDARLEERSAWSCLSDASQDARTLSICCFPATCWKIPFRAGAPWNIPSQKTSANGVWTALVQLSLSFPFAEFLKRIGSIPPRRQGVFYKQCSWWQVYRSP